MLPLPPGLPAPDADRLVTALSGCLDDFDLGVIARADYEHEADEHGRMLRHHIATGWSGLQWHPRKVLQLTSWDAPPRDAGLERWHWRRAFSCAALLRAFGEEENRGHLWGQNGSLALLIDSFDALADMPLARPKRQRLAELIGAAAGSLVWLVPRLSRHEEDEVAFFGLGLLWLALALDVPDDALVALTEWIMTVEALAATTWRTDLEGRMGGRWLLDNTVDDLQRALWIVIGARLPRRLQRRHGPAVVGTVELIAAMLADPPAP